MDSCESQQGVVLGARLHLRLSLTRCTGKTVPRLRLASCKKHRVLRDDEDIGQSRRVMTKTGDDSDEIKSTFLLIMPKSYSGHCPSSRYVYWRIKIRLPMRGYTDKPRIVPVLWDFHQQKDFMWTKVTGEILCWPWFIKDRKRVQDDTNCAAKDNIRVWFSAIDKGSFGADRESWRSINLCAKW